MDQSEQEPQNRPIGVPPSFEDDGGESADHRDPGLPAEEGAASLTEPPVFGGRNPSHADWFVTHEPEPQEEEPAEPPDTGAEELEDLLPTRERREAMVRELLSPFAVLLLFVFSLLIGIATVNIGIPASATVRATVRYVNYKQLAGRDLEEFQLDQDRLLRSFETRSMIANVVRQLPGGSQPSFATDDLEFHHRLDRDWSPEGALRLTVESPHPQVDARRLSLLARGMIVVSSRAKDRIAEAREQIERLRQQRSRLDRDFAQMRAEIEALEPEALKQSSLAEAALAMEQYLSLLEKEAPQRVAAEDNLARLRKEAEAARSAGEKRDALVAARIRIQQRMDAAEHDITLQEQRITRVVYPQPLQESDVIITDLRPARYNLLWIVTLVISGIFAVLVVLSFVRNARRELEARDAQRRRFGESLA